MIKVIPGILLQVIFQIHRRSSRHFLAYFHFPVLVYSSVFVQRLLHHPYTWLKSRLKYRTASITGKGLLWFCNYTGSEAFRTASQQGQTPIFGQFEVLKRNVRFITLSTFSLLSVPLKEAERRVTHFWHFGAQAQSPYVTGSWENCSHWQRNRSLMTQHHFSRGSSRPTRELGSWGIPLEHCWLLFADGRVIQFHVVKGHDCHWHLMEWRYVW